MHISLDAALQRQPLLSTVGDKLLPSFPGAAAAYSLRALNGDANNVVNVRRDGDDGERDFTAEGVALELEDWVNGKLEDTLPADVDTAAAAYSLRKVRNDYSGNAVQIRRASDDVEVNVAFDSNGEVSTSSAITNVDESPDAGDTTATTLGEFLTEGGNQDATVVTWYDQSGNGYDATQDTTGSQPKIAENGSLLAEGIKFDETDDFLISSSSVLSGETFLTSSVQSLTSASGSGAGAIFAQYSAGTAGRTIFFADKDANDYEFFSEGTSDIVLNSSTISTDKKLITIQSDGTNAGLFRNGSSEDSDSTVEVSIQNIGFSIGGASDGSFPYGGSIEEIIVYTSDQSDNRFKIESNINNYYGIYTAAYDGFVETWYDQSGNGNHASQTATGLQPKIVSAGSYLGELDFDGSDDALTFTGPATTAWSLSCVCDIEGATGGAQGIFGTGGAANRFELIHATVVNKLTLRTLLSNDTSVSLAEPTGKILVWSNTSGDGTINLAVDGGALSSNTGHETDFSVTAFSIGKTDNDYLDGQITEVVFYNSDQAANRTAIESNIADEYGITLS